jgi:hypothetical protein
VLAVNFYFSISNPFKRPQSKMLTYHIVVWSTSILTGFITMSRYGFRQDFQLCWNAKQEGINPLNWLSYFAWLFIFASLSLGEWPACGFRARPVPSEACSPVTCLLSLLLQRFLRTVVTS